MTQPSRVSIEVPSWVASLFDRGVQAGLVLVACAAAGFAILGLAWSGAAARLYVSLQLPYVISGALGGVALAGTCLAILAVHLERRAAAADRVDLDTAIRAAADLGETLPKHLARRRRMRQRLVLNGQTVHRRDCRTVAGRDLPLLSAHRDSSDLRACRICRPSLGVTS